MPTNKLWIEHTERAAWDSVEALREKLSKAESSLKALGIDVEQLPRLLELLDRAKPKFAPDARSHEEVVSQLLARLERLQTELDAAQTANSKQLEFVASPSRPPHDLDDLEAPPWTRGEDARFDLAGFAETMQRQRNGARTPRDLNQLLNLVENKVDDLMELEGAALREAAMDLAILAWRIHLASSARAERAPEE